MCQNCYLAKYYKKRKQKALEKEMAQEKAGSSNHSANEVIDKSLEAKGDIT
jgi:hypothetical protein